MRVAARTKAAYVTMMVNQCDKELSFLLCNLQENQISGDQFDSMCNLNFKKSKGKAKGGFLMNQLL